MYVGGEHERTPIMRRRVVQLAMCPEYVGEIVVCLGVVRFELQCSPELRLAFPHPAQLREGVAEIVVGQRVARLERDRLPVTGDSLVPATKRKKRQSQVAMEVGCLVVQCDGLADQVERLIIAAEMMGDDAEKVQAVDVRWIDRENLPVKEARRRQAGRLCASPAL